MFEATVCAIITLSHISTYTTINALSGMLWVDHEVYIHAQHEHKYEREHVDVLKPAVNVHADNMIFNSSLSRTKMIFSHILDSLTICKPAPFHLYPCRQCDAECSDLAKSSNNIPCNAPLLLASARWAFVSNDNLFGSNQPRACRGWSPILMPHFHICLSRAPDATKRLAVRDHLPSKKGSDYSYDYFRQSRVSTTIRRSRSGLENNMIQSGRMGSLLFTSFGLRYSCHMVAVFVACFLMQRFLHHDFCFCCLVTAPTFFLQEKLLHRHSSTIRKIQHSGILSIMLTLIIFLTHGDQVSASKLPKT